MKGLAFSKRNDLEILRDPLNLMFGAGFPIVLLLLLTAIQRNIPALLFVSLGLLCGSIFTDKQVGGICGALLTNLTAWLSGIWFDLGLVGGSFQKIANLLPFVHAVDLERAVLRGDYAEAFPHLWWVSAYAAAVTAIAVFAFLRQMKRQ